MQQQTPSPWNRNRSNLEVSSLTFQVSLFYSLWSTTRQLIALSSTHRKPSDWTSFLSPVAYYIGEMATIADCESDKQISPVLEALAVAAQAFKWVFVSTLSFFN